MFKTEEVRIGYKAVAVKDGRLYSIFDGSEYILGAVRKEKVRPDHGGGLYVYDSIEAAQEADVPWGSKMRFWPRVILKCLVFGESLAYKAVIIHGPLYLPYKMTKSEQREVDKIRRLMKQTKYAVESILPLEIVEFKDTHCIPGLDMEANWGNLRPSQATA